MTFPRFAPWNSMIGDSTLTPRVTTHEVKEEGRKATPTKSSGSKCNCRTQAIPHANISSSTSAARSLSTLGKNVPNRYCQKSSFRRNENTFSAPSIDLLAILKKNVNRTIFHHNLSNFRICTMVIEAPAPFNRTLRIKMYKNIARSRLFCRIAKRSIILIVTSNFPR